MDSKYLAFQRALTEIVQIPINEASLEDTIQSAFEKLLALPWVSFRIRDSFFLLGENNELHLKNQALPPQPIRKKCQIATDGKCACDRIFQIEDMLICGTDKEELRIEAIPQSACNQMCIALRWEHEVYGVLNLCINETRKPDEYETEFLKTAAKAIANIVRSKNVENGLLAKAKDQSILNQKLFAQSLEIDQARIEIESYSKKLIKKNDELLEAQKNLRLINEELQAVNENVESQKKIIENAHRNIKDSINYAKTIQLALITSERQIKTWFDEFFVLFRPKDQVSGDFYYVNKVDKYLIAAVGDCTGHGVPGGFLTMLGITYLHEIIRRHEASSPGEALNILRDRFKSTFSSFGSENHNGLDIALCWFDTEENELIYAGANSPIVVVSETNLNEFKPTPNPIGFYPKERKFQDIHIELKKNDAVYLFSDGFQDQFGEVQNRKFTKQKFRDLLVQLHLRPMAQQKESLCTHFDQWKGKREQIDDVTIMGIRWK